MSIKVPPPEPSAYRNSIVRRSSVVLLTVSELPKRFSWVPLPSIARILTCRYAGPLPGLVCSVLTTT